MPKRRHKAVTGNDVKLLLVKLKLADEAFLYDRYMHLSRSEKRAYHKGFTEALAHGATYVPYGRRPLVPASVWPYDAGARQK